MSDQVDNAQVKCEVDQINLVKRLAYSDRGYGTIETLIDANGDETQDVSIATVAVIEWFVGGWTVVMIDDFTHEKN